ncbi:hypothetical protein ACHAXS_007973, partial [Conticribra weissflogii]
VTIIKAAQTLRGGASTTTTTNNNNNNNNDSLSPKQNRRLQPQKLPQWSHKLLAGGASRSLAQALLYPVDALRTLAQTRDGRTLSTVGYDALLRGCFQTSSFALFTGALQFGIFEACKDRCQRRFADGGALLASGIAAAGSCLVSVPQEVIKQRLVTGVYGNFREAVGRIWREEGVRGFYGGWKPTVSRNVPFVVVTFSSRELVREKILEWKRMKRRLTSRDERKVGKETSGREVARFTALENLAIGITSALIAGVVTQPIDVVKTRIMTQAASNAVPYKNAIDCAFTIWRTEGWRKLYSGFAQRSIYMCGLWGITFSLEPVLSGYLEDKSCN